MVNAQDRGYGDATKAIYADLARYPEDPHLSGRGIKYVTLTGLDTYKDSYTAEDEEHI